MVECTLLEMGPGRHDQGVAADNRLLQGENDLSDSQEWNDAD